MKRVAAQSKYCLFIHVFVALAECMLVEQSFVKVVFRGKKIGFSTFSFFSFHV